MAKRDTFAHERTHTHLCTQHLPIWESGDRERKKDVEFQHKKKLQNEEEADINKSAVASLYATQKRTRNDREREKIKQ